MLLISFRQWVKRYNGNLLLKSECSSRKLKCLYASMPSSVYGYAVNEMMILREHDAYFKFRVGMKVLTSIVLALVAAYLQLSLLYYLKRDITNQCREIDNLLKLRLVVCAALLLHVIPSLRDALMELNTIFFCNEVIIEVNDEIIIQTEVKRSTWAIAFCTVIIILEVSIWFTVVLFTVSSIMSANTADEIMSVGLAIIFINEIDNMVYAMLAPERVKNKQARQLFCQSNMPSGEISPSDISSFNQIRRIFTDQKLNIFYLSIGVITVIGKLILMCPKTYQDFLPDISNFIELCSSLFFSEGVVCTGCLLVCLAILWVLGFL